MRRYYFYLQRIFGKRLKSSVLVFHLSKSVSRRCIYSVVCLMTSQVTDGPNGARGGTFFDGTTAACFPACVSLAATFDRSLSRQVGQALAQEAITKGAYVVLGPTVCCHRSPLGGRNFEAFSEDPYLSGVLAGEYVKGLQEERVAATVKHYLANEQDTRRFSVDQTISERALR
jgi:beta-glucosidase